MIAVTGGPAQFLPKQTLPGPAFAVFFRFSGFPPNRRATLAVPSLSSGRVVGQDQAHVVGKGGVGMPPAPRKADLHDKGGDPRRHGGLATGGIP
jgi:hypothetical protein